MPIDATRHSDHRFPQIGFLLGSLVIDFLPIPFLGYALAHMDAVAAIFEAITPEVDISDPNNPKTADTQPVPPSLTLAKAAFAIGIVSAILATVRTLVFIGVHYMNKAMAAASFFSIIPIIVLYIPLVGIGWNHQLYICDKDGDTCKNGIFDLIYSAWSGFNTGSPSDGLDGNAVKTIYAGVCFAMLGFGWAIFVALLVGSHYYRSRNPQSPYHGHAKLGSDQNVESVRETKAAPVQETN